MVRGPAVGYIYGVKDPDTGKYVFIGNGMRPWESIQRHLNRSSNPRIREWAQDLFTRYPNGVEILTTEVCDRWHGDVVVIPEPANGVTRLEWDILDEETETLPLREGEKPIVVAPRKTRIIKRLIAEGHPLLNDLPGRRPKKVESE